MTAESCPSCGSPFAGRYCSACGERRLDDHDFSFWHFVSHSLHDVTHMDAKILRSARLLITKPGQLTHDFFAGKRAGALSPVQLFVMVNLIFFFVAPRLGLFRFGYDYYAGNQTVLIGIPTMTLLDEARGERSIEEFRREFDHEIDHPKRLLIFSMVFLFAALTAVLMIGRHRYLVEHLVFALHYYAFWMLLMIILPGVLYAFGYAAAVVSHVRIRFGDPLLLPLAILGSTIYLAIGIRRFFGYGRAGAAALALVMSIAMIGIFLVYRGLLFLLALQLV